MMVRGDSAAIINIKPQSICAKMALGFARDNVTR